ISLLIVTYLIDNIIQGANSAKMVYIISERYEEIADKIMHDLQRGLTSIDILGMYKKQERKMLMCVLKKHELYRLRSIVAEIDKNAFIIFIGAREVSGEGFKIYPIN
ncbi:MAG: YitT family protein, partial [Clostridia bacterium]|nr:YitT family protein [Clostridia bacterium]